MGTVVDLFLTLMAIAALVTSAALVTGVLLTRRLLKRSRQGHGPRVVQSALRSLDATPQALGATSRAFDTTSRAVRFRSAALPAGRRGEIGRLRLQLDNEIRHSGRVVSDARQHGWGPDPFSELHAALEAAARQLDRQLALLEREPNRRVQADRLALLHARAVTIAADSAELRLTIYRLADGLDTVTSAPAYADLRDRIAGLSRGVQELHP